MVRTVDQPAVENEAEALGLVCHIYERAFSDDEEFGSDE